MEIPTLIRDYGSNSWMFLLFTNWLDWVIKMDYSFTYFIGNRLAQEKKINTSPCTCLI